MNDDEWAYTEEYVKPHSLCCPSCQKARELLVGVYDQAKLNKGYITSAQLDAIRDATSRGEHSS